MATLERWAQTIDGRLWGDGKATSYERSLEGRIAAMEDLWRNSNALADAARELRRTAGKRWSWTVQVLVGFAAIVTAVASVVAAYAAIVAIN